jgi:hypothetical protein
MPTGALRRSEYAQEWSKRYAVNARWQTLVAAIVLFLAGWEPITSLLRAVWFPVTMLTISSRAHNLRADRLAA